MKLSNNTSTHWFGSLVIMLAFFLFAPMTPNANAQIITFDNLSDGGSGTLIANGYEGFNWNNFYVINSLLAVNSGYAVANVSGANAAYNGFGSPASISSATLFNVNSVYITAAWNDGLSVQLEGYNGASLLYTTTVNPSATSPTLFTLNYTGITSLDFISSGGTLHPGYSGDGEQFAIDNLSLSSTPEPSTWAMLLGGLGLLAFWHRRKLIA